jgi:hypothetical protein
LGQHGFLAFALFLTLLLGSLIRLQRIRKRASARGDEAWIAPFATALQTSLVGYIVSGAFLSSAYFDLAYLFYALIAVFDREVRTAPTVAAVTGKPAETGVAAWRRGASAEGD